MKVRKQHIKKEWNEGHPDDGGDGHWILLNPGWKWSGDALGAIHAIHEATRKAAHGEGVMRCNCPDCIKEVEA